MRAMVWKGRDAYQSRARRLLERHIEAHWRSAAAFAEAVGITSHSISFLLSGRTQPTLDRAVAIERLTEKTGLPVVRCVDWVPKE